jgi:hypothetical protein
VRRAGALGFRATVLAPLTGCVALGRCAGTAYEEEMFTANSLAVIRQAILMCAAEVLFRVLTILLSFAEIQRTTAPSRAHVRNAYAHRVHAACNVQRVRGVCNVQCTTCTCNVQRARATHNVQHCDVRRATCDVQRVRAPCNVQHCGMQRAALRHATCSTATCNVQLSRLGRSTTRPRRSSSSTLFTSSTRRSRSATCRRIPVRVSACVRARVCVCVCVCVRVCAAVSD